MKIRWKNNNRFQWRKALLCTGLMVLSAFLVPTEAEDVQFGSLYFSLPEACTYQQGDYGLILKNGEQVGTLKDYPLPEGIDEQIQWQRELDFPEWQDETLGYFGDKYSLEFFSDVPLEQERTVMTLHTFFWDDQTLYDLCLDELKLDDSEREMILFTAALGGAKANLPYQFNLPEGYAVSYEDGNALITDGTRIVGGVAAYPIPDGVYDPYDKWFNWLADVGIPDYSDRNMILDGAMSDFWGGWQATFQSAEEDGTVRRNHHFTVREDTVYDVWMEVDILGEDNARVLSNSIHYIAPEVRLKTVTAYPEGVETTCELEEVVRPGYTVWLPSCDWPFGDREIIRGVPTDTLEYGENDKIQLRIATLAGKDLAAAQQWARDNWPAYDLVEDKRGGLGGTDDRQSLLDIAFYPTKNVTYAVIQMYPLEASEGGGLWVRVFADTFQLNEDYVMSVEEMDYLRCMEVMELARFDEEQSVCIENSVWWMAGDSQQDGAYTLNSYYWDGENCLVEITDFRNSRQEAVMDAHGERFCYTAQMEEDTPRWKPCQEEHEITEPIMSTVTFNKHYFHYTGNGNDAQGRGHRVSYEWLNYDGEGNATVYATVDFIFDDDGRFLMVQWKNGAGVEREFNVVESLASAQPDAAHAKIEEEYQRAVSEKQ